MNTAVPRRLAASPAVLLEVRGPDALRYLNGQITQNVRLTRDATRAFPACVTDAKGKLQFHLWLHGRPDGSLRISCDHEGAEELLPRLDRYLIADQAEIIELTGWRRMLVAGDELPELAGDAYAVATARLGTGGFEVWLPDAAAQAVDRLPILDADEAETLRIAGGVPAWGAELTAGLLPPEAGLDRTDISYSKGCYIGQEVISRIKTAGKLNRRLAAFEVPATARPGDALGLEGREVGQLTSVAPLPGAATDLHRALGYLAKAGYDQSRFALGSGGEANFVGYA